MKDQPKDKRGKHSLGGKRVAGPNPKFRILLKHCENKVCGVPEVHREYDRLKLEVAIGVSHFWKRRGVTDPGSLVWSSI